jgi:hypothetical protein
MKFVTGGIWKKNSKNSSTKPFAGFHFSLQTPNCGALTHLALKASQSFHPFDVTSVD